jgi:hypothetical protein
MQSSEQEMVSGADERQRSAESFRKMTEERRGATERELTKFRALAEVFGLCEPALAQHRAQIAGSVGSSSYVIEGLDAAIEEIRRLQRQTQEFALKNEGALNALTSLEDLFKQAGALSAAVARDAAPKVVALAEVPSSEEDSVLGLLDGLDAEEDAKEPIEEPKRGASRKPK